MALRAGTEQRERLHTTFETLCRMPSPTGDERAVADWVAAELRGLGLDVTSDAAGGAIGSNAGNLLARIGGSGPETLLLCAHMDTVPPTAQLDPVRRDGGWQNASPGIIGADNKAALAAMIELARMLTAGGAPLPPVSVELLCTVSEETGLQGAKQFDTGRLRSRFGYVFDHASPIGEIVTASPTYMSIQARVRGRAAHAGVCPERGVNAIVAAASAAVNMPQGRLDEGTTANVGMIAGGTAANVVPDLCTLTAEIRAIDQERLDQHLTAAIDALEDAADSAGCDLDLDVQELFSGYRLSAREPTVALARRALGSLGYEPTLRASGGGSDANALRRAGFPCTNLANGTENAHELTERVTFSALEGNLDLMLALVREAGLTREAEADTSEVR